MITKSVQFSTRKPKDACILMMLFLALINLIKINSSTWFSCEAALFASSLMPLLFCIPNDMQNDSIRNQDTLNNIRLVEKRRRLIVGNNDNYKVGRLTALPHFAHMPTELSSSSRRKLLDSVLCIPLLVHTTILLPSTAAIAMIKSTLEAKVTDKIFIEVSGLSPPTTNDSATSSTPLNTSNNRIVIGLFGEDAPGPVSVIKQLVSDQGYSARCKPREERMLQKEQLEANKVYNSCIENEERGVTYDLSQVWRVSKNRRIDLGAVSGKYVAREYPNFFINGDSSLRHDSPGVVSVRRGNDGGFGFTIYPGGEESISNNNDTKDLDSENIVIGRVLEGMDVVSRINDVPVIQSAKLSFAGQERAGPSRACRYGSTNLYCNELKPLRKLLISRTGIIAP